MSYIISFFLLYFHFLATEKPCNCSLQHTFPIPPINDKNLFYIQRTPNHNTIMYDLNVTNGKIDSENPVHIYWIRYGEDGQKEELSYIQQHYAYGLNSKRISDERYELRFVSYKKLPFYIDTSPRDRKVHIQARVHGQLIEVKRVFLQIEGGHFWFPNVVCVEVKGVDPDTGKEVIVTFKP